MRFAEPMWLWGAAIAVVVAVFLVAGGVLLVRAERRFGEPELVGGLTTARAGGRRALKGVLLVLAVLAGFVALAGPQYGRGTRLVPATNLDVVIVLDYSKSMFARDVTPSRIERAKAEVGRLVRALPGARFGAVAFAGEPVSFPLTSDGASIAQFFRQLSPNDMPVGGTAIARALESGRRLFDRDPLAKRHEKAMLLVTDGEDLEGDPVAVAKTAASSGVTVHVVQVGGRTPEPIPDVSENGEVRGWRRDRSGQPLTTALSAEGEQQLAEIAEISGGSVVRSTTGDTGITAVADSLRRHMTEELSERVETVYADVYYYPAALAALLLLIEGFISESQRRRRMAAIATSALVGVTLLGCDSCIRDPFVRHAPEVDEAIAAFDAGDAGGAAKTLTSYLSTGPCKDGNIGTPDRVRHRPGASFDLGLALYAVGKRFGTQTHAAADPAGLGALGAAPSVSSAAELDCARKIVGVVRGDPSNPPSMRAMAHYLAGNLELLNGQFREAVAAYDESLELAPATDTSPKSSVPWRAAFNRAIALARAEEAEREPPDAGESDPGDGGEERSGDGGSREDDKRGDGGRQDPSDDDENADGGAPENDPAGPDGGSQSQSAPEPPPEPKPSEAEEAPPPPMQSQDQRMLDQLEQVPTVQQEVVRRQGARKVVGMEDK